MSMILNIFLYGCLHCTPFGILITTKKVKSLHKAVFAKIL